MEQIRVMENASSESSKKDEAEITRSLRRQKKVDFRRQQIFSAALRCFEKNGYHQTSIIEIATTAGISSGLMYQYFADKRDLLYQVILEILERYNRDIPSALKGISDPLLRLQAASIAYYRVIDSRVSATLFAYRETGSLDHDQRAALKEKEIQTNQLIMGRVLECVDAGYCIDVNPELAAYWIINSAHAWGLKHWRLSKIISFENYVRESLGVIINGMLNDAGHDHWIANDMLDGRPLP